MKVNGVDYPLRDQNGILAIEDEDGTQHWAVIQHAQVNYVDQEIVSDREFRMELTVTLAPGQTLLMADSTDADEENVLMYSRLLVALLREERDRYAELGKDLREADRHRNKLLEQLAGVGADHAEGVHRAWANGARSGYTAGVRGDDALSLILNNPHPLPEDDQEDEDGL